MFKKIHKILDTYLVMFKKINDNFVKINENNLWITDKINDLSYAVWKISWDYQVKIDTDYFTKEYINKDATTTRKLYVVESWNIDEFIFNIKNKSQEVKKIKWEYYLFM